MEKKTIGSFIATLRKANGMTQKTLAEKLNVSDKTVSRWERDDGAPDLSLIPVIAEIFGVTCDELLRGEKKEQTKQTECDNSQENSDVTPKGEKQRKWLLTVSLSKYKMRTTIAIGISVVGLIAAMIANFGFLRAYIGFFVSMIFYLVSIVCQIIFVNNANLSVSTNDFDDEIGTFKHKVILMAERSIGVTVALLGISLPLVIFADNAYVGIELETWFFGAIMCCPIPLLLYSVARYFVNARFVKNQIYSLGEKKEKNYWYNHRLKKKISIILIIVLFLTYTGMVVSEDIGSWTIPKGIVFEDYDSFIEYMEQDIPDRNGGHRYARLFNGETGEEYVQKEELLDANFNVVCEYSPLNGSVEYIDYDAKDGTVLPITVYTYDAYQKASDAIDIKNYIFIGMFCVEIVVALAVYMVKRKR